MKIYTKTGDGGTTALIGGERVAKYDLRVEAYGSVDELTSFIALLSDELIDDERTEHLVHQLQTIECRLMTVAALLAVGKGGEGKVAPIAEEHIAELEELIDAFQAELKPITKFTIPGGHRACSLCHVCRTVCRRAERAALRASTEHTVDSGATRYLNRLSDYLYTLGRVLTERLKVTETLWIP
ncbi:MAG: cob(I)yrinic acid a,c-diamide adenosyltransferase [Alistipes sp.]|nr:cob(I)yrinic acid a,c-diamide adenosyltransferase [Alistipes sp.]